MEHTWMPETAAELATALEDFVAAGGAPGGVAVVGTAHAESRAGLWEATPEAAREEVSVGTLGGPEAPDRPDASTRYDMASLTKVIATWPLIGYAVDAGRIDLDAPIGSYAGTAPAIGASTGGLPSACVTIRQVLSHASGLMQRTRLDRYRGSDRPLVEQILAEPLESTPGTIHEYISRGFILLGLLLPGWLGRPLMDAARDLVWRPAGMIGTTYGPVGRDVTVAPTERYFPGAPRLWGQAHDENARLLGGIAGHAGVFASAADLAAFAGWLLDPDCPLTSWWRTSREPHSPVSERDPDSPASEGGPVGTGLYRCLAWLRTDTGVFYHDGFTGVSLYLRPEVGRYIALCTNAVHNGRARTGLRELREHAYKLISAG